MLISHSRPRNIAWALRNAAGTALAFMTTPAALTNGRPGSVTRFVWPSGAYAQLEATWSDAAPIGLFGIYGTTLPPGMRVDVAYRIAGTSVFTASPALTYVIERPMGERVAWVRATPVLEGFDAMRLRIRNSLDVGGAFVAPGTVVELGEIWLGQVDELEVNADWAMDYEDPTASTDTDLMQPYSQRGTVRRVVTFTPTAGEEEPFYENPSRFPRIERLLAVCNRGRQTVVAPRYDEDFLSVYATFGTMTRGGLKHVDGPCFEFQQMTLREAAIPVVVNA